MAKSLGEGDAAVPQTKSLMDAILKEGEKTREMCNHIMALMIQLI